MSKLKSYRTCFIPLCANTTKKTPEKLFLNVPQDDKRRNQWFQAAGRVNTKSNTNFFCCEDHFDLKEDMENYLYYTTMGGRAKIKKNVVPHIFTCEPNRSNKMPELTTDTNINTSNTDEDINIKSENESKSQDEILECRACLQRFCYNAELIDLFKAWDRPWDGMGTTVAEDLSKLANIEISTTDAFSKHICQLCYQKLLDACSFSTSVHSNDQVLRRNMYEITEEWPKPIIVDNAIKNAMEVEIKQEPLSDDEADNVTECMGSDINMQSDLTNLEIKVEPEEIIQPHPIKITVNGTITNDQFAQNSLVTEEDKLGDARFLEVTVKQEPQSEDEDSELVPDLPLECMLCTKSFNSVSGLKLQAHVIAQHSYKTVKRKTDNKLPEENGDVNKYVCALCRRRFTTSTDLMVHETCHNKHSCYGCNEKFDTFALLTCHREKCKAVLSKKIQKPKTLEDVKRPQIGIPELTEIKVEPQELYQNNVNLSDESSDGSNVKVLLKIKSLNGNPVVSENEDIEMKLDNLEAFSEDDVIQ